MWYLIVSIPDLCPLSDFNSESDTCTVKPVLSDHTKIDKTKVLKSNGNVMKVESIANAPKQYF